MTGAVVLCDPAARGFVLRDPVSGAAVVGQPDRGVVVVRELGNAGIVVSGFAGPSGAKGAPGDSSTATGRVVVSFAFGDASPRPIFTPATDCTGVLVRVVIDTPFDGSGAAIALGTAADPAALMGADQNDPAAAAGYEVAPDGALVAGVPIVLSISPGSGATRGAGRVIFDSIHG